MLTTLTLACACALAVPVTQEDPQERLEQLRALALGMRVAVRDATTYSRGIDTPADLTWARERVASLGEAAFLNRGQGGLVAGRRRDPFLARMLVDLLQGITKRLSDGDRFPGELDL